MDRCFNLLVSSTCSSLAARVSTAALTNSLLVLQIFGSGSEEPLLMDHKHDFQEATSIGDIFDIVRPYMSFLNPEILAHVIEFLGTDDDRKNYKDYMKVLEDFCTKTEAATPCQIGEMSEDETVFQKVKAVIETSLTLHFSGVRKIKKKVSIILKLNSATLQIKCVSNSPNAVLFIVPNIASQSVFPLLNEQERDLKSMGVISLECGAYSFQSCLPLPDQVSEEIELPCLGRPFRLGMFYDCRNDNLILGIRICEDYVVEKTLEVEPTVSHHVEVLAEDTMSAKALSLGLTTDLKLSLLSNMVQDLSGSAKYWREHQRSNRQARVCLKYESSTCIKRLPLGRLGEIQHHEFEHATHIVTRVLYGLDAYCLFDRMLGGSENYQTVQEDMTAMVKARYSNDESQPDNSTSSEIGHCTVYSDIGPSTLHETVDLFHKLPTLPAEESPNPIPKKVWLYPLNKLDNRCSTIVRHISTSLANELQGIFEHLHASTVLADDQLCKHNVTFSQFQSTYNRLTKFTEMITTYRAELRKDISELLPGIREGTIDECELAMLIEQNNASPFNFEFLSSWLKHSEEEVLALERTAQHVKNIDFVTSNELKNLTEDHESEYVVCLAFHVALEEGATLNHFLSYLQTRKVVGQTGSAQPWYTNMDLMKKIHHDIEHFKAFAMRNMDNKGTKFVVTNCKGSTDAEPSSIFLYKSTTSRVWEPPGPPSRPCVKDVTHDTVQLDWTKPEYGSQSVEFYNISYHPEGNPQDSNTVSSNNTEESFVVEGLRPKTSYIFTIQSNCSVGVGAKSDTSVPIPTKETPLSGTKAESNDVSSSMQETSDQREVQLHSSELNTISMPMALATSQPGKPRASTVSCNSIMLEWSKPEHGSENVEYYMVFYRPVDNSTKKWKRVITNDVEQSILVGDLSPSTKYVFKVRPELDEGIGIESEVSEPSETKSPICQPGKPKASVVTHNSISLEWNKPECGSENVDSYCVFYCSVDSVGRKWKRRMTESAEEKIVVTGLSLKTKYIFKVRPELGEGVGTESKVSEPIETASFHSVGTAKPTANAVSDNSVQLKWSRIDCENIAPTCIVFYCFANDISKKWKKTLVERDERTAPLYTVTNLSSDTMYLFKIRPVLDNGDGAESDVSDPIGTKKRLPSLGKPTPSAVSHNSIQLNWTKSDYGANSIHYTVYYHQVDGNQWNQQTTDGVEENITLYNLARNTKYVVKVASETGDESELSDPIETKATSPPGRPTPITITHDSITVKWSIPKEGSETTEFYTVCYCSVNNQEQWEYRRSESTTTELKLTELEYNSEYIVKVCTDCKDGAGAESECSEPIATLPASTPCEPTATNVTHSNITLTWLKPIHGSENVISYHVFQRELVSPGEWKCLKTSSKGTAATIQSLEVNTKYVFKVKAICQSGVTGESKESKPIETKPACKPGKPWASNVTHNTITLACKKPKHQTENVVLYFVYYRKNDTTNWKREVISEDTTSGAMYFSLDSCDPGTSYVAKVEPRGYHPDHVYLASEPSDPIETKLTSPAGKPYISLDELTNVGVTVRWTAPTHGKKDIKFYTIRYRALRDPNPKCECQNSSGPETHLTIAGLSMQKEYVFRVVPKCRDNKDGTESDSSDPIEIPTTSRPGTPTATKVTSSSITIRWIPPECGKENIKAYTVFYRQQLPLKSKDRCPKTQTNSGQDFMIIGGLNANTPYTFKVKPICKDDCGIGSVSEESDPISTSKTCKPGRPTWYAKSHNSIELKWEKPLYAYENVQHYTVQYRKSKNTVWDTSVTGGCQEHITCTGLSPDTSYIFRVQSVLSPGTDVVAEQALSEYIKTEGKPLALRVFAKCKESDLIHQVQDEASRQQQSLPVYKVPNMKTDMDDSVSRIAKRHFGVHIPGTPEKVIMLLGATGAGKSTLINCMINYILGVHSEHEFRFKLIHEESGSQAHSQTSGITAYTIYAQTGSPINFDLTIVDTPGFGDTRGIKRDRQITKDIKEFFSIPPPLGVDVIHGIGFVVQASHARLTPTQVYIFDSILSMFGKDIAGNIFLMATFADGRPPQTMAAIKAANIECRECFTYNNSMLYASMDDGNQFGKLFWDMNKKSNESLFNLKNIGGTDSISLQLTREVQQRRDHLETLIQGLQENIKLGLDIIQEMQQEEKVIIRHKEGVLDPDFTYEVEVPKQRKVSLPPGKFATNCVDCKYTCHTSCTIKKDDMVTLKWCAAMGGWFDFITSRLDPNCANCPGKCNWKQHRSNPFRYEIYSVRETRTLKDLMERYLESTEGDDESQVADKMISNIKEKLQNVSKDVLDLIKQTQQCLKRLREIAFKPHPLNEEGYIDLMIETEKREAKEGFSGRINGLEALKEQARLLSTFGTDQENTSSDPKSTATTGHFMINWHIWKKAAATSSAVQDM